MPDIFDATAEALRSVTPDAVQAYVTSEGWTPGEGYGDYSTVFYRQGGPELIIPRTAEIDDYASAIAAVLSVIARHETRPRSQVYQDLIQADRDIIRVRAPSGGRDGTVMIGPGVTLFEQSRVMVEAAACAAVERRATYRGKLLAVASDYMSRVRLGQTERGSFIVTVFAPVTSAETFTLQSDLWPDMQSEPFDRAVTRWLGNSLQAAQSAAESAISGSSRQAFTDTIASGVSANLCEALAAIVESGNGADVSLTWAKTRPAPEPRRTVSFSPMTAIVFREAARIIREHEPRLGESLLGFVSRRVHLF